MNWLRKNENASGIVYFLDDYKVYSLEIFEEVCVLFQIERDDFDGGGQK